MVVGTGAEDVAQGMPGQRPDARVVRIFHGAHFLVRPGHPEHDSPVGSPAGKEALVDWMPCQTAGLFLVSPKGLHLLIHLADVEQLQQMVPRRRQEPVAVAIPLDFHHCALVCVDGGETLPRLWVPEFDGLLAVLASGNDERFLRVPVDALDIRSMTSEDLLFEAAEEVPNTDRSVVGTSGKFCVRRAKTAGAEKGTRNKDVGGKGEHTHCQLPNCATPLGYPNSPPGTRNKPVGVPLDGGWLPYQKADAPPL